MGYIYGPGAAINVSTGIYGKTYDYVESGNDLGDHTYWLLGSAICREYNNQNIGVAYIGRNTDASVHGDILFAWDDVYYLRGE
jgi:hypothetical protein